MVLDALAIETEKTHHDTGDLMAGTILCLNAGSSSLKFALFRTGGGAEMTPVARRSSAAKHHRQIGECSRI